MSLALSTWLSDSMVSCVIGPEGTMTQMTRGPVSASASAARLGTSDTSGRGSNPMTSWPASRMRWRMLKPILPRPTKPSCMAVPFLSSSDQPGSRTGIRR